MEKNNSFSNIRFNLNILLFIKRKYIILKSLLNFLLLSLMLFEELINFSKNI